MSDARKRAEEALRGYAACPPEANLSCVTCTPRLANALRALLAETAEPAPSDALPLSDEDECPCCLTHSCQPFRRYAERTLRPAPSDAVREAGVDGPVLAWARLAVALLSRHESAWDHDPGPGEDDCDEDCRACEYTALLRTGRAALAAPRREGE